MLIVLLWHRRTGKELCSVYDEYILGYAIKPQEVSSPAEESLALIAWYLPYHPFGGSNYADQIHFF